MARTPLATAELGLELTNGNDGRGSKWFRSSAVRKKIEAYLRYAKHERMPFECQVVIEITRVLGRGQRLWDSDSKLRGNSKELIDALVACGWFHDDGPKWVSETLCHQDASRRSDGPLVVVEVFESFA